MAGQPLKRQAWREVVIPNRDEILERIETGESLTAIAAAFGTKRHWLCDYFEQPANAMDYTRSRVRAATALAESVKDIADVVEPTVGELMKAKLRMQSRQWLAKHWDRDRYGEAPVHTTTVNLATLHADVVRRRSAARPETDQGPQIADAVPVLIESSASDAATTDE